MTNPDGFRESQLSTDNLYIRRFNKTQVSDSVQLGPLVNPTIFILLKGHTATNQVRILLSLRSVTSIS